MFHHRLKPVLHYNSAAMSKELRVLRIHGKVQGVGYRFFAKRVARRLGLKGWITNQRDGSVEAAVKIAMDLEDPASRADRLLQAMLLIRTQLMNESLPD